MTFVHSVRMIGLAGLGVLATGSACLRADAGPAKARSCVEAWQADVQPIVDSNCVACHQNASPAGGLSLQSGAAPASVLGVPSTESKLARIEPGDPAKSYLFHKIKGTHLQAGGSGDRMPIGGQLTDAEISSIERWIAACPANAHAGPT